MKISIKDLKAAILYMEKNSDRDTVTVSVGNEFNLISVDSSGSEIQITLYPTMANGEASLMAKVKRTELLPFK